MSRVQVFGLQEKIGQILIPTEDVVEMKGGKKVVSSKLFFPGYILVEMNLDDETWHLVRNTPKVSGFVSQGNTPTPLTEEEVNEVVHPLWPGFPRPEHLPVDRGRPTVDLLTPNTLCLLCGFNTPTERSKNVVT